MSEEQPDEKGRIRTSVSPAEWTEDQQGAAPAKKAPAKEAPQPGVVQPIRKADPPKKAS
jgi:hypothetical protein